jgi:hypothetical protein
MPSFEPPFDLLAKFLVRGKLVFQQNRPKAVVHDRQFGVNSTSWAGDPGHVKWFSLAHSNSSLPAGVRIDDRN